MPTQCTPPDLLFEPLGKRSVVAAFDGGSIASDAGGLLLREVEAKFGFLEQFARCFTDHRDPDRSEHSVLEYEDCDELKLLIIDRLQAIPMAA